MQFVKLQLGCLLIIMYIVISYIRETLRGHIPCNKYFDALMAVAPWTVFFDGLTAWTVNHMDLVPAFVNRGGHLLFFLSMDLYILATTAYFYDQLLGFRKKKIGHLFLVLPGLLSLLLIIGGIILVVLGLIGEYIGRIYMCINASPQFVEREVVNFLIP